jgi:hypothetical protein
MHSHYKNRDEATVAPAETADVKEQMKYRAIGNLKKQDGHD